MAISSGSMNRIIGPTRPTFGSPLGWGPEAADPADRGPAGLDEERRDEAPGDEGGDVGHDHAGQERAELLHRDACVTRPADACLGVHGHVVPPGSSARAGRTPSDALRRDKSHAAVIVRFGCVSGPAAALTTQPANPEEPDLVRVARFYAPEDVRIEDAPEPSAGPGELVIRVRNCSTCGTDAKIWRSGHPDLRPPRVLGHEVAGEVAEVGDEAGGWSVGDRVQVIAAIPDGSCHECRRGGMSVCPNQERIGYHHDGGFAELMRVPARVLAVDGVNRIPRGLSFAEASVG